MPFPHHPPGASDGQKLADVLDRLAAALEQQTRSLLELKGDVSALAGGLRRIEDRLGDLESKQAAVPAPVPAPVAAPVAALDKSKGAAKKRSK